MNTDLLDARCRCCSQPTRLLPRHDLAADLAVCPRSGRMHRAGAGSYDLIADGAAMARRENPAPAPTVYIDLSKEGYA